MSTKKYILSICLLLFAGGLLAYFVYGYYTPREPVRVLLGGDIYAGNRIKEDLTEKGPAYFVGPLAEITKNADLHLANLESPITRFDTTTVKKRYLLSSAPEVAGTVLSSLGVDGVSLANNHIMDYGPLGLLHTFEYLNKAGIKYAGAGANREHAERAAVFERRGRKIALLAFSNTFPRSFWSEERKHGTAFGALGRVKKRVEEESAISDHLIVSFHWGSEKDTIPQTYQRNLARAAIDAGADVVFGHHPHVLQPVEKYRGKYIFYSLGNYFFTTKTNNVQYGLLVDLTLGDSPASPKYHLININNFQVNYRPHLVRTFEEPHLLAAYIKENGSLRLARK
jgi:poly-gamma-glutamate synthesis protein (capsule biosynthesis protein)